MESVGTILRDRYELIAEIGKGGMSTVYLAKDRNLESYWAVKRVKNNNRIELEAFKKEVELLSSLSHSDIPRIVDRIEQGDDYYVIMDFVDGTSLGKMVLAEGHQPEELIIKWAKMLCEVLDYLHTVKEDPIVYRDMKPENVMLTQAGRVKLIDFGIAKECKRGEPQTDVAVGTKGYAAPEQYKGASNILDERTDIYSLGAALFFIATGVPPGKPPKAMKPIRQINGKLSEGLEYIISKCTKDDPEDRYKNCREMKEDLDNIHLLNSSYRRKMVNRLKPFVASVALMVFFGVIGIVGLTGTAADAEDAYQNYYQKAAQAKKDGKYDTAADYYIKAIENKPQVIDTYVLLFDSLVPKLGDKEYVVKKKDAIDTLRNKYLENKNSAMYKSKDLMYYLGKKCIEVDDPAYGAYALEYFDYLKKKHYNSSDIGSYQVIASNSTRNLATQDFKSFNKALEKLSKETDSQEMDINYKLDNYYTIMSMYSSYPTQLDHPYDNIYSAGDKARKVIQDNFNNDTLKFNHIIDLYQLVAISCYNQGIIESDDDKKQVQFERCIRWFDYLDDMNAELTEAAWLKKANAYKGIFDLYDTPTKKAKIGKDIYKNLDQSIREYEAILDKHPDSFPTTVCMVEACLDKELIKESKGTRNFSRAQSFYHTLSQLKASSDTLSDMELLQYSSVKQAMKNAGLE